MIPSTQHLPSPRRDAGSLRCPRLLLTAGAVAFAAAPAAFPQGGNTAARELPAFARQPVRFVERPLAAPGAPRFEVAAPGGAAALRSGAIALAIPGDREGSFERVVLSFEGADPAARLEGEEPDGARHHDLRGGRQEEWTPRRPSFRVVGCAGLYPGVDLVLREELGQLEYDLLLAPGAEPSAIVVRVDGADSIARDRDGSLSIRVGGRTIRQSPPKTFALAAGGARHEIPSAVRIVDSTRFGFELGLRDPESALVIDPGIVFATYVGGASLDDIYDVAVGSDGAAYLTGRMGSGFTTTPGAFQPTYHGGPLFQSDAFALKLQPNGASATYATYLGGSGDDIGYGIGLSPQAEAIVYAVTGSFDLPLTPNPYSVQPDGGYVAKLSPDGSALVFATTFVGHTWSTASMEVDAQGFPYVAGLVAPPLNFATPGAFQTVPTGGNADGFVAKMNLDGSALVYATYLSAYPGAWIYDIALDAQKAVYAVGETSSTTFPVTPGAFQTVNAPTSILGGSVGFVAKLSPQGDSLHYCTYLGGTMQIDRANTVSVDAQGSAVVGGFTSSADFPVTGGTLDPVWSQPQRTFVARLSPAGDALIYSTFIPPPTNLSQYVGVGSLHAELEGAILTGVSTVGLPYTPDAFDTTVVGYQGDAFVARLSPLGTSLTFASYLGGSGADFARSVAVDSTGAVYAAGFTDSKNFPVNGHAYDKVLEGTSWDGFLAKITVPKLPFGIASYGTGTPGCLGPQRLWVETPLHLGQKAFVFGCDAAPIGGSGGVLLSDLQDLAGSDPFFLGIALHVDLFSPNVASVPLFAPPHYAGMAANTVVIPSDSALLGKTFYAQALWLWPQGACTPSLYGLSTSNGLAMTVIP